MYTFSIFKNFFMKVLVMLARSLDIFEVVFPPAYKKNVMKYSKASSKALNIRSF